MHYNEDKEALLRRGSARASIQRAFGIVCRTRGSVLPEAAPIAFGSAFLSLACLFVRRSSFFGKFWAAAIDHPFAVQVFGIMFGFFLTNRVGLAIARWWKGTFAVNQMTSKWMDAYIQIVAFVDREVGYLQSQAGKSEIPQQRQAICQKIEQLHDFKDRVAHWFSLMVAMAIASLWAGSAKHLSFAEGTQCMDSTQAMLKRRLSRTVADSEIGTVMVELNLEDSHGERHTVKFEVIGQMTSEECAILQRKDDKVLATMQWILEALTLAHNEQLLTVSAPILSRCYQELSNGILGFNEGLRVAALQYPFPLQQMMMLMMNSFVLMMPVVVEKFTQALILTPILTFFIVLGYWGLNAAAIRLESPFSDVVNDLTLGALLEQMNNHIREAGINNAWQVNNLFSFSSSLHEDLWGSENQISLMPIPPSKLRIRRESADMSSAEVEMHLCNREQHQDLQQQQQQKQEREQQEPEHKQEAPSGHQHPRTTYKAAIKAAIRTSTSEDKNPKSNQEQPATASTMAEPESDCDSSGFSNTDSAEKPAQNPQCTALEELEASEKPMTPLSQHQERSYRSGTFPLPSQQVLVQPSSPHVFMAKNRFEDPPLFPSRRFSAGAILARACPQVQPNSYGGQMIARNPSTAILPSTRLEMQPVQWFRSVDNIPMVRNDVALEDFLV